MKAKKRRSKETTKGITIPSQDVSLKLHMEINKTISYVLLQTLRRHKHGSGLE